MTEEVSEISLRSITAFEIQATCPALVWFTSVDRASRLETDVTPTAGVVPTISVAPTTITLEFCIYTYIYCHGFPSAHLPSPSHIFRPLCLRGTTIQSRTTQSTETSTATVCTLPQPVSTMNYMDSSTPTMQILPLLPYLHGTPWRMIPMAFRRCSQSSTQKIPSYQQPPKVTLCSSVPRLEGFTRSNLVSVFWPVAL